MRVLPSILSADFANLTAEIEKVSNCDGLHIDIMDFHYVPNLTMGPAIVKSISAVTDLDLDCHLMIENPQKWAKLFIDAGVNSITFHLRTCENDFEFINYIKSLGCKASIAIKPKESVEDIIGLLDILDMVLIMTVEPGFGGQSFMPEMIEKIKIIRKISNIDIQVDGGISAKNIKMCADAGATCFVAGSSVFNAENPKKTVKELQDIIRS